MSVESLCVKYSRPIIVLDEPVSVLNQEKDVLLKVKVEACLISIGDAKSLGHRNGPVRLHKKSIHACIFDKYLTNFYVEYIVCFQAGCK